MWVEKNKMNLFHYKKSNLIYTTNTSKRPHFFIRLIGDELVLREQYPFAFVPNIITLSCTLKTFPETTPSIEGLPSEEVIHQHNQIAIVLERYYVLKKLAEKEKMFLKCN